MKIPTHQGPGFFCTVFNCAAHENVTEIPKMLQKNVTFKWYNKFEKEE